MKRVLSFFLCAALLCGCTQMIPDAPSGGTEEPSQPTVTNPQTLYWPESGLESDSEGALQAFLPEGSGYTAVISMGDDPVLMRDGQTGTELTLLSGPALQVEKRLQLSCWLLPGRDVFRADEQGFVYADHREKAVVWLDASLQETKRMLFPKDATGCVLPNEDGTLLYYGAVDAIRVLDTATGVSRTLQICRADRIDVENRVCGRYLKVRLGTQENNRTALIDVETGQTVHEGNVLEELVSWGDWYSLPVTTEGITERVFGVAQQQPQVIWPGETDASTQILPLQHRLVTVQRVHNGMQLSAYDLDGGLCVARVPLIGYTNYWGMCAGAQGTIWFFLQDDQSGREVLCRWDVEKSSTEEETVYTSKWFTREDPDTEGYARLKAQIAQMEQTHGIDILFDGIDTFGPLDYVLDSEYLVPIYTRYLEKLEQALTIFPEGMLRQVSAEKPIYILLVRGIYGSQAWDTLDEVEYCQYWKEENCYIAITMNENLQRNLIHGLALAMENKILSTTSALYEWNTRNPAGFAYDNDYIKNQYREDTAYLEGENRAFINLFSMSYAKEDRATIMEYACLGGSEEYFASEIMQGKLRAWCSGVRKAFGLSDAQGPFLWEQYLQKPL